MQHARIRILPTTFVPVLLFLGGCKPEQKDVPAVEKPSAVEKTANERSRFFTQMAEQKGPTALVNWLQSKFPDIEFTGGQAGPAGGGGWTQVELVIVVRKSPRAYSEDLLPLLTELEQYCRTLAESNGAEIQGKIEEQLKDGTKQGFKFDYRAQTDSGLVRASVPGSRILLTVSERE